MSLKKAEKPYAVVNSHIIYFNLPENVLGEMKKELTFKNPTYEQVMRFSRWSTTNVPQYLTYFKQLKENAIEVPIGYSVESLPDMPISDERVRRGINTPPFLLRLRKTQIQAFEQYMKLNESVLPLNGCIQMPTGKGKSILGLYIAKNLCQKTLIVVHKDDLVRGWQKDIDLAFGGKVKSGLIKAKKREVGDFLTIATVQTLNRLSREELEKLYGEFGLVIQDELHHCPSSSFSITTNFKARYRLGLTATLERSDGLTQVISLFFGKTAYKYEQEENEEDILPVEVRERECGIECNPVCIKKGNSYMYSLKSLVTEPSYELKAGERFYTDVPFERKPLVSYLSLDKVVTERSMSRYKAEILSEFNKGHSCVAFFMQKESCRHLYEILKAEVGEKCVSLYYGDNDDKKNAEVLEMAEKVRKHITITTYAKATEGTNCKQWEVAFFCSSMNSGRNVEQAMGRIRRSKEGKINPAIVYDFRYPNCILLSSHGRTRDNRYQNLGCFYENSKELKRPTLGAITRGFK